MLTITSNPASKPELHAVMLVLNPTCHPTCHTRSDESLNLVSERGTGWLWRYSRQGSTEAPPRLADRDRISLGHRADRSLWHRVASQEGVPMPDPAEVMAAPRAAGAAQLETYLGRTSGRTSAPPAIDIPTRGGAMSAIDLGAPPGAITSDHTGGQLDFIRTAILSLQHFAEQATDDQDIHTVTKCITALQGVLADHGKGRDAALGVTPALRHVRQRTQGY